MTFRTLFALAVVSLGLADPRVCAGDSLLSLHPEVARRGAAFAVPIHAATDSHLTGLAAEIEHDAALCAVLGEQELRAAGRSGILPLEGIRCPADGRISLVLLDLGGDGAAPGTSFIPSGSGPIAEWSFRVATTAPLGPFPLRVGVLQARNGPLVVPMTAVQGVLHIRSSCIGDCNDDDAVTVDEVISGVNLALGTGELTTCYAVDGDGDESVTVDEIVTAVNLALNGCPAAATTSAEIER